MEKTSLSLAVSLVLFMGCLLTQGHAESSFFRVDHISHLAKEQKEGRGIWKLGDVKKKVPDEFSPCVEATLQTGENIRAEGLTIKAYFFDSERNLVGSPQQPEPAFHKKKDRSQPFDRPVIFYGNKPESVFFRIPQKLQETGGDWSIIVVFGDAKEATARAFPNQPLLGYKFAEKSLVEKSPVNGPKRIPIREPVVEHVVQTRNPKHPKITLFLRFPNATTDASEIQGVLAMCVLANHVGDIRRKLEEKNSADYGGLYKFADANKLAILCWGAQTLWRPDASYDELERETNIELDRGFDIVAAAWERGVEELHSKYNIPVKNYLLWGVCASAQWAHRLVLRKPNYFLAAFLHIPSSFDKPTPEAAKVLWLLTSGELDGGYQHGTRWYADCRAAGYPIIYKAVINLGHAGSPIADNLGTKFFEYALSLKDEREALDKSQSPSPRPWPEGFRQPAFVGDYLNQEIFPSDKAKLVPESLRVPLPTKSLAEAWNK